MAVKVKRSIKRRKRFTDKITKKPIMDNVSKMEKKPELKN